MGSPPPSFSFMRSTCINSSSFSISPSVSQGSLHGKIHGLSQPLDIPLLFSRLNHITKEATLDHSFPCLPSKNINNDDAASQNYFWAISHNRKKVSKSTHLLSSTRRNGSSAHVAYKKRKIVFPRDSTSFCARVSNRKHRHTAQNPHPHKQQESFNAESSPPKNSTISSVSSIVTNLSTGLAPGNDVENSSSQQFTTIDETNIPNSASKMRLTLSAFKRPETAVRLTTCDPTRNIETDYNFNVTRQHVQSRILGHGVSSTVKIAARKSDGIHVAVKCIPKHEILRDHQRMDECLILQQISHPNVVRLHSIYENDSELFFVMDLCKGGDLYTKVVQEGPYKEQDAKCIVVSLLDALQYLHDLGILHGDVKPENVLLSVEEDHTKVKLADFGMAKRIVELEDDPLCAVVNGDSSCLASSCDPISHLGPSEKVDVTTILSEAKESPRVEIIQKGNINNSSRIGSYFYSAPELNSRGGYGTSVDMYSLGVCTYVLLYGLPPCFRISTSGVAGVLDFPVSHCMDVSSDAKEFIRSLVSFNPKERPTALMSLKHKWLNGVKSSEKQSSSPSSKHLCHSDRTIKTPDIVAARRNHIEKLSFDSLYYPSCTNPGIFEVEKYCNVTKMQFSLSGEEREKVEIDNKNNIFPNCPINPSPTFVQNSQPDGLISGHVTGSQIEKTAIIDHEHSMIPRVSPR